MKRTYPIDLSALAYPLMETRRTQSNFHFTARLTEKVDPCVLKQSLAGILVRYPVFKTKITPSFFWHVLRKNDAPFVVKKDERPPLAPLRKQDTNGYPFRIAYSEDCVTLEIFHAVTDGNVGAMFMADLLTRYAEIKEGARDSEVPARRLVAEDAFLRFGQKKKLSEISLKKYNGASVYAVGKRGKYRAAPELLSLEIPLDELKAAAKAHDATLTEYVAACYIAAVLDGTSLPLKKDLCLFIPVDLRRFFPSDTMQNFVCFERICLQKGENDISLPHLISVVQKEFRSKITKDSMKEHVDDVYRCFTLPAIKYVPLFVKSPCFKLAKALLNKVRQTAILSNVGAVTLPERAMRHVKNIKFFLNVGKNAPLNVAILTYNGICNVDVTNGLEDRDIPDRFFKILTSQGKK